MSRRKKQPTECYLCGEIVRNWTDDHLPPECLAPKNPRSTFELLPACKSCNNSYSDDENSFRDFIASISSGRGIQAADDAFEAWVRRVNRHPIPTNKVLTRITDNIIFREAQTPEGIYTGRWRALLQNSSYHQEVIERVTLKIARGLHYHVTQHIVPSHYAMRAMAYGHDEPLPKMAVRQAPESGGIGNFFRYWGYSAQDDPKAGIWFFAIYNTVLFQASFIEPSKLISMGTSKYIAQGEEHSI